MKWYIKIFLVTAILISVSFVFFNQSTGSGDLKVDFQIESGQGSINVAKELFNKKLIKSTKAFRIYLLLTLNNSAIKKGVYQLDDSMTLLEVIATITSGKTKFITITIPEGYNNRQIGDLLSEAKFFKDRSEFITQTKNPLLLKKYNIAGESLEGYLFPDTYNIPADYPQEKVLELMVENFLKKTDAIKDFPQDSQKRHQLVILASIVEREAQLKEERPVIAGVFNNRLQKNYPLESCATIQYLFEKPKPRLFFKDLEIKSPYNTYIHAGMPPGPISNPGLAAIQATLRPVKTDYLFFVVKESGSHHFSKTFNEHVKAKQQYLAK